MTVFFGTRRVYVEIPAEGSTVRTLIAAPGQQISAHFADLVPEDAKTTERPTRRSIHDAALVHTPPIVAAGETGSVDRGETIAATSADLQPALDAAEEAVGEAEARADAAEEAAAKAEADRVAAEEKAAAAEEGRLAAEEKAAATAAAAGGTLTLKGAQLDGVLAALELSKSGTVDEKRARVAEALAAGDAR